MAFEKLNFGKADIQENRFWEIGIRKNGLSGGKYWEKRIQVYWIWDFERLLSTTDPIKN